MKLIDMNLQQLQEHAIKLQFEKEAAEKETADLKAAILIEVERIEKTPKAWRWLQYGKLLFELVDGIRLAIQQSKAEKW